MTKTQDNKRIERNKSYLLENSKLFTPGGIEKAEVTIENILDKMPYYRASQSGKYRILYHPCDMSIEAKEGLKMYNPALEHYIKVIRVMDHRIVCKDKSRIITLAWHDESAAKSVTSRRKTWF